MSQKGAESVPGRLWDGTRARKDQRGSWRLGTETCLFRLYLDTPHRAIWTGLDPTTFQNELYTFSHLHLDMAILYHKLKHSTLGSRILIVIINYSPQPLSRKQHSSGITSAIVAPHRHIHTPHARMPTRLPNLENARDGRFPFNLPRKYHTSLFFLFSPPSITFSLLVLRTTYPDVHSKLYHYTPSLSFY
jgi:hypothetical protein